ncbi:MAG: S8 family serine peptidase [Bdellovibrionia bacterium]
MKSKFCVFLILSFWTILFVNTAEANGKKEKIKIAVIDTGVDLQNPYLKEYISPLSKDFTASPRGLQDEHGHGTHIISIIVDQANLDATQLEILVLKYFDPKVSAEENLKRSNSAIRYAVKNKVQIINYSAGGLTADTDELNALKTALQENILVIAAAGNERNNSDIMPFFPANYPLGNILSVGAHDQQFAPLPSSNFGQKSVHIAALGKEVLGYIPNNQKAPLSGTSQATAIVTGLATKLYTQRRDLRNPVSLKEHILKTGVTRSSLKQKNMNSSSLSPERALKMRGAGLPALINEKLASVPQ